MPLGQPPALVAIKNAAAKNNVSWQALASIAQHESGLNPANVGDNGTSFGLFQLHQGGALPRGTSPELAKTAAWNANYAARQIKSLGIGGKMPIEEQIRQIAARFERPTDVQGEINAALGYYRTRYAGQPAAAAPTPLPAPKPAAPGATTTATPASPALNLSALQANLDLGQQASSRAQSALGAISGRVQSTAPPIDLSAYMDIAQAQEPTQNPAAKPAVTPSGGKTSVTPIGSAPLEPSKGVYASPLGNPKFVRLGMPYQGTHSKSMNAKSGSDNWESENAVDMGTPVGTPIYATQAGTIGSQIGNMGTGRFAGKRLHLVTGDNEFYYAHLSKLNVKAGQHVQKGQLIGYSGEANGTPHLHIAAKKGNPVKDFGY